MESRVLIHEMDRIRVGVSLNALPKSPDMFFAITASIRRFGYFLYKPPSGAVLVLLGTNATKETALEAVLCAFSQLTMGWDAERPSQVREWNIVECLHEKGWDTDNLDLRIGSYRVDTAGFP